MFPPATPESMGLPSAAVMALLDRLEREGHDPHSLIAMRDGRTLAEGWWAPFRRDRVHRLYSLSKSFTSTAVGLAIHEGRLGLDDRVIDFFPDETPDDASENLRAMRVRDLLTMTCGQDWDDRSADMAKEPDGNWARAFLRRPVPHRPGTFFFYSSSATYMLSAILQRRTGERLLDYLRPRLLDPLGVGPARWESDPRGIDVGGWGLYLTTEAIARFGQLLLQRGRWGERQLVPEAWLEAATQAHADNSSNENPDWRQGYGFQFWRCRHGCFRGDGAFGQFCVVSPARRLVIAITSAADDMQGVLDAVWEELLAPLRDEPLSENPDAVEALRARLAGLQAPSPEGERRAAPTLGGLSIGVEGWAENEGGLGDWLPGPVAARGAWQRDGSFKARLQALESTESMVVTIPPGGGEAVYTARGTWGPREGVLRL